jgi:ankyrin repeat protein
LQVAIFSPPSTGPSNAGAMLSGEDTTRNRLSVLLPQKVATPRPRIPRVAVLIAGLSHPSKSLITTMKKNDILNVHKILNDQRKLVWLDRKLFDRAMCRAAARGHEQVIWLLLEKGADVHAAGKFDDSVLQCASENGHEQVVQLLLEKGTDIDTDGGYGSALHQASQHRHRQVVWLLLEMGADVNAVAVLGSSPATA